MSENKKNILIVTNQFIPYTKSIGGIARIYGFAQKLKKDFNLFILCRKNTYFGYLGLQNELNNIETIFIDTHNSNSKIFITLNSLIKNIIKILFRNMAYVLALDEIRPYKNIFLQNTLKIISKNKIDILIISAPPFSLFSMVNLIKIKFPSLKIILDYRDGWTQRVSSSYLWILKKVIFRYYEKKYLSCADLIIASTNTIKNDLDALIKTKSYLIYNGFLSNNFNNSRINSDGLKEIKIGYFGLLSDSFFSYRNIDVIYKSSKNIDSLKFHFFGNSNIKKEKYIKNKNFFFYDNVDYHKLSKEMLKMDYLMIFHTEKATVKEVITGKFFEYLKVGVPIIVITNGVSEASILVNKYNLGLSIDYSKDNLKDFFLSLKKIKIKKNYDFINNFSRDNQNNQLISAIKKYC